MREFGQQLSTIWLPFQKTQCFHGESSNGRKADYFKKARRYWVSCASVWLTSAEIRQYSPAFVQRGGL